MDCLDHASFRINLVHDLYNCDGSGGGGGDDDDDDEFRDVKFFFS